LEPMAGIGPFFPRLQARSKTRASGGKWSRISCILSLAD